MIELNAETDFVARNGEFRDAALACARLALDVAGDLDALLRAPAPDGDGCVSDLVARLSARTGERVALRRSAFVSAPRGRVVSYLHNVAAPGLGSIGVLLALDRAAALETPGDIVEIGRQIAMHVAASAPSWISTADIPASVIDEKRAELLDEAQSSGKPAAIVSKMVDGRLQKFFAEVALELQPFVLDPDRRVDEVLAAAATTVTAFARFRVGEGLRSTGHLF